MLFEWELAGESWTDQRPHSEYNFVIEGQLFVESDGVTLKAQAGDVVRVPAGAIGRYWAPTYARLLAIYGRSKGQPSKSLSYKKLNNGRGWSFACAARFLKGLPVATHRLHFSPASPFQLRERRPLARTPAPRERQFYARCGCPVVELPAGQVSLIRTLWG